MKAAEIATAATYRQRVALRTGRSMELVDVREVDWITADGNYVVLHLRGGRHRVRGSISALESELDPQVFVRLHRSTIVNARRIVRLELVSTSDRIAILANGTRLPVGRSFRGRLEPLLAGLI
ncbi:MAG: LytTR family DNA-binding domain-containing protein [Acidobacteriota bacterium]